MRIDNCIITEIGEQDDFYNIANQIIGKKGTADDIEYKGMGYYTCRFYFRKGFYCKNCGTNHEM